MVEHPIFLITGPMAAGKTTVAKILARRFERGVHLEGDFFRRSIVTGQIHMTPERSNEALDQLRFRYRLAASAAREYHSDRFTVVIDDVVAGPLLDEYAELLAGTPLRVVVLLPSLEEIEAREAGRPERGYDRWPLQQFYEGFIETTPRIGLWLDTTSQSPEETVDEILRRVG